MAADALLDTLNPAQKEAVLKTDGPLLVLAGAGSGKTRVLTTRLARLVQEHGVQPRNILAVTFTNKAAGEMRERVSRMLGDDPKGLWIGTFHAIGARMLRMAPEFAGRTKQFTIYDQDDTQSVIKRVMERLRISPKEFSPRAVHATISDAKNQLISPAEFDKTALDPFAKVVAQVYPAYEDALRIANATDFDDLLVLPVRLLQTDRQQLGMYQAKFHYIMVDEYQDTNRAQYQFIKLLAAGHRNICVVGDDDQSIYGWRGADIRNILDFNKDFPDAAVVRLEENYRSDPPILALANVVISANTERMGKTLRPTRAGGERVTTVRTLDERDEADWVVTEMAAVRRKHGLQLRDLAVLYRTNSQSRAMEESLRRQGTPYRLIGSVRFYDRREIRDLMAYLKLIGNPSDDEAFRRAIGVPRRGLGETTIELIAEHARATGQSMFAASTFPEAVEGLRPAARTALGAFVDLIGRFRQKALESAVDELLEEVIQSVDYTRHLAAEGPEGIERIENVKELITSAAETVADELGEVGLTPLDHFLQRASLVADIDSLDPSADAVLLMTLHNAKGLEFPVVFITGLEDGLFPLARAYDEPKLLEEERRLFYVGITRAERKLYLTHAEERRRNGELLPARQSSFLDAIPPAMLDAHSSVKVRSSGRGVMRSGWSMRAGGPSRFYGGGGGGATARGDFEDGLSVSPSTRRPGSPVQISYAAAEDESQDEALYSPGSRVRHAKFGSGTIAEVTGVGRDAKVKIDFDDEAVGRKTLVVSVARLARGDD
jgi:DNA helicase II / ATP-dependent DNA helicase PcrA